jgi:hypothetical protein
MKLTTITAITAALLAALPAASQQPAPEAAPAATGGLEGFLYGRVETRSDHTYTGLLRWGTQEFFWDDLFNSTKQDLPYYADAPDALRYREARKFGLMERIINLAFDRDWHPSRQFWARFGDIASIRPDGRYGEVRMKSGSTYRVKGGGDDVGGEVRVYDATLGQVDLEWRNITSIEFLPTPAGVHPPGTRLWGDVSTRAGSFQGFVQWDDEECISIDKLDGESEDGDMSIDMGRIRSIARNSRRSSHVVLNDGRSLDLSGTNDVDETIRGIYVEDPRYGRVEVSWDAFDKVEFKPAPGTGLGYGSYPAATPLAGTVTARGGATHRGRLVFDLDESEGCEMLNGDRDGVAFYIPFSQVASVVRQGRSGSRVKLRNGEEVLLEDSQDVSSDNAGVLVFASEGADPLYLAWDDVERIDFR